MILETPITGEDIKKLRAGDVVYMSGELVVARDRAHKKLAEAGALPPQLNLNVIYHCGPIVHRGKIISAGPTTSARMNEYAGKLVEKFGTKIFIGKGGMTKEILKGRAAYLSFTGGCGALAAKSVRNIKKVYLKEFGEAEAVYVIEVEKFGPLVVSIDSRGNSLYDISK